MREITVERTGVIEENGNGIYINSENIVDLVMYEVDKQNPKKTDCGTFAGKVRIMVELLGDLEDGK